MELKLKNAIKVNGILVDILKYDPEAITVDLFVEADSYATKKVANLASSRMSVQEMDNTFHLCLFWASAIALDAKISFDDMNQVKGMSDIKRMTQVGRSFILTSEDDSEEETSGEPSEITPEPTTPVPSPSSE